MPGCHFRGEVRNYGLTVNQPIKLIMKKSTKQFVLVALVAVGIAAVGIGCNKTASDRATRWRQKLPAALEGCRRQNGFCGQGERQKPPTR